MGFWDWWEDDISDEVSTRFTSLEKQIAALRRETEEGFKKMALDLTAVLDAVGNVQREVDETAAQIITLRNDLAAMPDAQRQLDEIAAKLNTAASTLDGLQDKPAQPEQ